MKKEIKLKNKLDEEKEEEIERLRSKINRLILKVDAFNAKKGDSHVVELLEEKERRTGKPGSSAQASLMEGLFLPSLNIKNYEEKSIDYRWKSLPREDRKLMEEIVDLGSEAFAESVFLDAEEGRPKVQKTCDFFLSYKNFASKVNDLVSLMLGALRGSDMREAMENFRKRLRGMFKATRLNMWVKDTVNNDLWTIHNFKEIRFSSYKEGGEDEQETI